LKKSPSAGAAQKAFEAPGFCAATVWPRKNRGNQKFFAELFFKKATASFPPLRLRFVMI
jgi:hypothetical protein